MKKGASVNKDRFLSSIWLMVSLLAAFAGYLRCRSYSFSYIFRCDQDSCIITRTNETLISFPSADLAQVEIMDIFDQKDHQRNKVGNTLKVWYDTPADVGSRFKITVSIALTPHDLGKTVAKAGFDAFQDFKRSGVGKKDTIDLSYSKSTTPLGLAMILIGSMSALMSAVYGRWSKHRINYSKRSF